MPLPNPFCGICKPKGEALQAVVLVDTMIAFVFLVVVFAMLMTRADHGKIETVSEILAGLFVFLGAIFNLVLQPMVICADHKKSLKGSLIWLIFRVLADGICGFTFHYLAFQADGAVGYNGRAIILVSPAVIIHLYVWYVVLAFTQQLHLDAVAAAAVAHPSRTDLPVEKGISSIVRQRLAKSEDQKNNNITT